MIMAWLNPQNRSKRPQISIRLPEHLLAEIGDYCQWIGIAKLQDFFEQAAEYILNHDQDWIKERKPSTSAGKNKKMTKN